MFYERRLPHLHPEGKALFFTWRLNGSLPPNRYVPPDGLTSGQAFVWIDRYLDQARTGPTWLNRPEIARIVDDALHYGAATLDRYVLHAYVIMANHVHMLISPKVAPPKIMHSLKGFTAHEANRILSRTGSFWQRESYDHFVRDRAEFDKIVHYIENNPVKAGLVSSPEDFRWSSAHRRHEAAACGASSPACEPPNGAA
jgi:putative transposase